MPIPVRDLIRERHVGFVVGLFLALPSVGHSPFHFARFAIRVPPARFGFDGIASGIVGMGFFDGLRRIDRVCGGSSIDLVESLLRFGRKNDLARASGAGENKGQQ
jgi:hypothetical protein